MVNVMDNLEQNIADFISKVPKGCIFDAHSVISYLLKKHTDDYLEFHKDTEPTNSFHSRVSRVIKSFVEDNVIERIDAKSYSLNIRGNFSENSCWKKLSAAKRKSKIMCGILCLFISLSISPSLLAQDNLDKPKKTIVDTLITHVIEDTPDGYIEKSSHGRFYQSNMFYENPKEPFTKNAFAWLDYSDPIYDKTGNIISAKVNIIRSSYYHGYSSNVKCIYQDGRLYKVCEQGSSDPIFVFRYDMEGNISDIFIYRQYIGDTYQAHFKIFYGDDGAITICVIAPKSGTPINLAKFSGDSVKIRVDDDKAGSNSHFVIPITAAYRYLPEILDVGLEISFAESRDRTNYDNNFCYFDKSYPVYYAVDDAKSNMKKIYEIEQEDGTINIKSPEYLGSIEVDNNDNLLKINIPAFSANHYFKYTKYDKYGNWTECYMYHSVTNAPVSVTRRTFRYY